MPIIMKLSAVFFSFFALSVPGRVFSFMEPPIAYVSGDSVTTVTLNVDGGGPGGGPPGTAPTITIFAFEGPLYSEPGFTAEVGSYSGTCTTTSTAAPPGYYCSITDRYPEGEIAFQGFGILDGSPGVFVAVGGTGEYKNVRGTVSVITESATLFSHQYDFT